MRRSLGYTQSKGSGPYTPLKLHSKLKDLRNGWIYIRNENWAPQPQFKLDKYLTLVLTTLVLTNLVLTTLVLTTLALTTLALTTSVLTTSVCSNQAFSMSTIGAIFEGKLLKTIEHVEILSSTRKVFRTSTVNLQKMALKNLKVCLDLENTLKRETSRRVLFAKT
jgi:hypothetical protein